VAELVLGLGVPHTPLLWKALAEPIPPDLVPVAEGFQRFRTLLDQAHPDLLVVVGSDHLRAIVTANMPAFLIGKADRIRGTLPSEERSFSLPATLLPGHSRFARGLLGGNQVTEEFDFSYSDEPWLDHSFMVPLLFLRPALDLPVVPLHTNTSAPPIPRPARFLALGRYLSGFVQGWPGPERVALICSGHMAFELGGPRQFQIGSIDPGFDGAALSGLEEGNTAALLELITYQRMLQAGNLSFQFQNFLVGLAAFGERPTSEARTVECRFGNEPFFAWIPS
jgi:hypothetical protein